MRRTSMTLEGQITKMTTAIKQAIKVMGDKYGSFFFQAEDGIRDVAVTGVQTCALPISSAYFFALRSSCASLRGLPSLALLVCLPSAQTAAAGASPAAAMRAAPASSAGMDSEIGRASCRERVEISVVAVSLKKKKGKSSR